MPENRTRPAYRIIGKAAPRPDAWAKVFGDTAYAHDYTVPGMLCAKVLRSRHPAARVLSIDTGDAEKLPGVDAVLTAKDVPNNETATRFGQTHQVGGFEGLYRVLAEKKIRFKGEAVALVAATSEAVAEEALGLIHVEYEPLEGVFDPVEAKQAGAYQVGEDESNVICSYKVRKGDVEEGFKLADVVVEQTYRVPMVDHAYLEPESGVAWLDQDGVITIRSATQVIEHFRGIADVLGVSHNRVRIIAPMLGGGFGGKEDITVETYLALLVWKTRKPVSLTYTREESIRSHGKRHPYVMRYKTGATKAGKLVALEAELTSDAGGYVYLSPWVLLYSTVGATGPYDIPHVKVDSETVLTNNTFSSANRGFGAPQVCFACESQLDELAKQLGLSPLEIRRKNYLRTGDALATGRVLEHSVETEQTADRALEALGEPSGPSSPTERIGRGIASSMTSYGRMTFLHDTSRALVSIEMDGSVSVRCGLQDVGGGQASSLAQIAAEVLGVPMEDVTVYVGDSALTPLAGTTTATRLLYMSGNATKKAATAVRHSLVKKAADLLDVDPEELAMGDRQIYSAGDPDRAVALERVVKACAADGIPLYDVAQFNAPARELIDFQTGQGQVFPDFTFGTQAMEVSVDIETGAVKVLKIVSCYDVGQAINTLSAEGQLHGGALYGLGYGMMEEVVLDKGNTLTPSFAEYLIPSAVDVPDVKTIMIESGGGVGPFGAKGLGEPSCVPAAAAFANAVSDAIGARVCDLPVTPERILKALGRF
ncbi:MAG: xanthine dehydrogenase family protein molybdopterin-binding subunit [Vicinamibacterales bacterium]|nr:xanthine dehydrogenase [Acidobacteriota bacterium]MDP6371228.1 xanthine dehydrogenase family protein molybdopterin-binding subunit [Vicinamibacterales bacterium]MDP7618638.1 xanthine dehydrogenase family protein molybdopterin-binding subunit [Dehalococcoidia bacterium]MBU24036.1 xanthine dehydrogenase [Acidobacteriota bacterium]MDP6610265.1 xanthine dehydrogenase family protein molybdopterin-binding subunit [Vicinamibacterales bacterium]|tara:strand:- start:3429 stop:5729 length:2301 start_codon:yes stop_codon:yes gene_type:complete